MKKVLAMVLVLAMLIPLGYVMPAQAEEIKTEPFYILSWSDFDEKAYPYLDGLLTTDFSNIGEDAVLSLRNFGTSMRYGKFTDAEVTAIANAMKKELEKRPEGMRYWHTASPAKLMKLTPDDALFMDFHVEQMAVLIEALMKKLAEIQCPLDGVVVDVEYVGLSTYYLVDTGDNGYQTNNYIKNPKLLKQIVSNPLYKTRIRPLLEEYGFIFYKADTAAKQAELTELYSITKNAGSKYSKSRLIWDTVMRIHLNRYVDEWLYTPLQKYYPEASCSDYQSTDSMTWMKMAAVTDDGVVMSGGNTQKAGDTSTYSYYYLRPSADDIKNLKKIAGFNDSYFVSEPFSGLLYDINFTRHMYASTDTKQIAPWIAGYTYVYTGDKAVSTGGTAYYADLLYHLGMFDPEPFLSYTYTDDLNDPGEWDLNGQIMNDIMKALSDVAGYADREPIELPQNWNSKFVLTGMYCGGRNLWRITPNINIITRSDFLISDVDRGEDPAFFINGETVTFPGGKILTEAEIPNCGSVGYWVETPKDVVPVVTAEEDRYEAYPSMLHDFEIYEYGAFNNDTAKPVGAWGIAGSKTSGGIKGESNIVTIDGNKKLSIIGNSKNWVQKLPANITAGDTYAKDQAWQVTVTIPEGLSKDAKITILNYAGEKQEIADGGFMVQDGKIFYGNGQENPEDGQPLYTEMMDAQPGTTYIFERRMNFNDKDAFTCTYVVKNKNGRTLKSMEDVSTPAFSDINNVGFSVVEADKSVLVDDFKIFLIGTALDFNLYDAKTGQAAELNSTRERSTAYRLSWLNATAEEETATIKADITENGKTTTTVVKEIKMLPGTDGIETGIVQIKEGQTVKVYLESSLKPIASADEAGPLVDATFNEGGIQKVPSVLKNLGLDTPEKIKEALEGKLNEAATDGVDAFTHYDIKVNKNDIPRHGKMTVIMPYPADTDAGYTFYAAQLYTAEAYGKKAGDVEVVKVVNTAEGIQFEIFGTSPIVIGWTAPVAEGIIEATAPTRTPNQLERPVGTRITRPTEAPEVEETEEPTEETEYIEETEAPTEETEAPTESTAPVEEDGGVNIVLIIVIAVVVLAAAGAAVWFLLKKKPAKGLEAAEATEGAEFTEEPEENTEQ